MKFFKLHLVVGSGKGFEAPSRKSLLHTRYMYFDLPLLGSLGLLPTRLMFRDGEQQICPVNTRMPHLQNAIARSFGLNYRY